MNILDKQNLSIIHTFLNDMDNNKFLLINGPPGSGKSTLAKDILKNTIPLHIDSADIKYYKNIKTHILNIIYKNNITLMLQESKKRSLIIDDMHVFKKNDKSNYKHLIDLIKTETKIKKIIIDDTVSHYSNYNHYLLTINITPNTLKLLDIDLPAHRSHEIIQKYNSNIFKISKYCNSITIYDDDFHSSNTIIYNLLHQKYDICNIEHIITHNDTMIILCLLELIIYNIPLDYHVYIKNIYNNYVIADIYEKYFYTYNITYLRNYVLYLTCSSTYYINNINNIYIDYSLYNKYNSKSSIICQHFYNYNTISAIFSEIFLAYSTKNHEQLTDCKKKYKKYKKIFFDIYQVTF